MKYFNFLDFFSEFSIWTKNKANMVGHIIDHSISYIIIFEILAKISTAILSRF